MTNRLARLTYVRDKMRNQIQSMLVVCVVTLCISPALAQTQIEVDGKYTKLSNMYLVSDNIWMSARYSADSQVCEMVLFPKRVSESTVHLNNIIPFDELKKVLEEVAPLSQRGKEYPGGFTWIGGSIATTVYAYENVTIDFRSTLRLGPFKSEGGQDSAQKTPLKAKEDGSVNIDLQLAQKEKSNWQKQSDDFSNQFTRSAEIVVISWKNRKCLNK